MQALCAGAAFAVLALVAMFLWQRGRVYAAVFRAGHVREFARAVQRLKEPAMRLGAKVPTERTDERVASTSAGLHVAYTAMPNADGAVEHHVSVSLMGGYTAAAVGGAFARLAMESLGFARDAYVIGRSQRGIWHGAARLNEREHAAFAKEALPTLEDGAVDSLFEALQRHARTAEVQQLTVR
jgi:hypothetical protein